MTPPQTRRYDLDWLRVLLFGTLVPFHALLGFVDEGTILYGYRNQDIAGPVAERILLLLEVWHMPALFLISGVATFFVMQHQGVLAFLGNRLLRIFFPLVIGIVFWNAVIAYYQASITFAVPPFPQFWWDRLPNLSFFQADHLWFLVNLLCYSILSIPLFRMLLNNPNGLWVKLIPFLAVITVLAVALFVKPSGVLINGYLSWETLTYAVYYVLGFWLMIAPPKIWQRLSSLRYATLLLGCGLVIGLAALLPSAKITEDGYNLMTGGYWYLLTLAWFDAHHMTFAVLYAINTLVWCAVLLGFAHQHLNHPHRWLAPLNRAIYPLYIFHMVFIFVGLYYLRFLSWPWFIEFLLLTGAAFVLSAGLYLLFDRVKILRPLVGLSPRKPKPTE